MDDKFYEAAIPEPWTVLGLRLRPFSIGHLFILNRLESAFFHPKIPMDIGQITMAVSVCAQTYEENLEMMDNPDLFREIFAWNDRLTGANTLLVRMRLKKEKVIDWNEKAKMMLAYFGDVENVPTYSQNGEGGAGVALPVPQIIKVTLMKHLHIPEGELMDRPWALCMWDFISLKAMEGQVSIYDIDELNQAQRKADELSEKLSKLAAGGAT